MNAALELKQVTKRFGATQILRGVDLGIREGERHALIGPNGAGKSTLFDLIAGRTQPTSGHIALNGIDVTGMPAHRLGRKGLARSFQTTSVFTGLTVRDNVRCAVLGSRVASWKDRWFRSSLIDQEAHRVMTAHAVEVAARARRTRKGSPSARHSWGKYWWCAASCAVSMWPPPSRFAVAALPGSGRSEKSPQPLDAYSSSRARAWSIGHGREHVMRIGFPGTGTAGRHLRPEVAGPEHEIPRNRT